MVVAVAAAGPPMVLLVAETAAAVDALRLPLWLLEEGGIQQRCAVKVLPLSGDPNELSYTEYGID